MLRARIPDDAIRRLSAPVVKRLTQSAAAGDIAPAMSDNSRTIFEKRYLRKGPDGAPVESVPEAIARVSAFVAAGHLPPDFGDRVPVAYDIRSDSEKRNKSGDDPESATYCKYIANVAAYFRMISSWEFVCNSPTWTGAGTPVGQLAACFVLPLEDDMSGIMRTMTEATLIQKSGGGNGFCFSNLRPKGAFIASSAGQSTGPIGFLATYDHHFGKIAQGGTRRGANMGVFRVDHPDIREFITCKMGEGSIENFNISVNLTDAFFAALDAGTPFPLIDPHTGEVTETVDPRELWDMIVHNAWRNGEPGVLFMGRGNRENPVPQIYELEATNPCVTGDTWVTTPAGPRQVSEIVGRKTALLLNGEFYATGEEGFFCTGEREVVEVATRRGYRVRVTPDHKIRTAEGADGWTAAGDLAPGDTILLGKSRLESVEAPHHDRVAAVTPLAGGPVPVYDVQVPGPNEFEANGVRVANCGEQLLGPHENCCLGSVNLAKFWLPEGAASAASGASSTSSATPAALYAGRIDWRRLQRAVETGTRFLDDVVSANKYVPEVPQLTVAAHGGRRIGLGIMGLGDLMYLAGARYGDPEGELFAARVMAFVKFHCMRTSVRLAAERGPFPWIAGSVYDFGAESGWRGADWAAPAGADPLVALDTRAPLPVDGPNHRWKTPAFPRDPLWPAPEDAARATGMRMLDDEAAWEAAWRDLLGDLKRFGIRNMAQLTVAPTGTIASVAGCEGYGCEPVFALAYMRRMKDGDADVYLPYGSPLFTAALCRAFDAPADAPVVVRALTAVADAGTCQGLPFDVVPAAIQHAFVVSSDISPEGHIRMQAAMQRYVDNSMSKTCNLPNEATEADVAAAYRLAYDLGCKGVTVYRAGSRDVVVLETAAVAAAKAKDAEGAEAAAADAEAAAEGAEGAESGGFAGVAPTHKALARVLETTPPARIATPADMPELEAAEAPAAAAAAAEAPPAAHAAPKTVKRRRPRRLIGFTYQAPTAIGTVYATINVDVDGEPFELFARTAKGGTDLAADAEAIGRLVSYGIRSCPAGQQRAYLREQGRQLRDIGGRRSHGFGADKVHSMPDAIGLVIKWFLEDTRASAAGALVPESARSPVARATSPHLVAPKPRGDICPECGNGSLMRESGCLNCHDCGFSLC